MQQREPRSKRKSVYKIKWVVSKHRKDRKAGVINPGRRDPYTQYLMDKETERIRGKSE
ncbi:hypothetical protein [Niallia sp. 03190]|uniref:hypothetical protein n=1 Tax=Niallia sp. 03190 TaxID=3458061 RepID=UPI00404480E9